MTRDLLSQLGKALNGRRAGEADIFTNFQVVRPLDPRGLTVVKSECNDQEIVVGNVSGLTFAPGASVMIGTNTNRPGKAIIAGAPPGRMGASLVPQDYASRTYGSAPEPEPGGCPTSLLGRSYLAIRDAATLDGGSGPEILYAWRYTDGEYQETLAEFDYSGLGLFLGSDPSMQRVHTLGDTVVFTATHSGWDLAVCTWDVAANTMAVLNCTHPDFVADGSKAIWNGAGDMYFFFGHGGFFPADTKHLQMYKVPVGSSGVWDEVASRVGAAHDYVTLTGFAPGPQLLHSGGNIFQVPSRWYGDPGTNETVAYFSGAWNEGHGRKTLADDGSMGDGWDGYAISGGRSIRITFGPNFEPPATIGVMPPPPDTPETSLLSVEWYAELAALYDLHVSPSGEEFVVFVDPDGSTFNRLLRWGVSTPPTPGCPIPYFEVEPAPPDDIMPAQMFPRDY